MTSPHALPHLRQNAKPRPVHSGSLLGPCDGAASRGGVPGGGDAPSQQNSVRLCDSICRQSNFMSRLRFRYLARYEYAMRVDEDEDVCLQAFPADPFAMMREQKLVYGFGLRHA